MVGKKNSSVKIGIEPEVKKEQNDDSEFETETEDESAENKTGEVNIKKEPNMKTIKKDWRYFHLSNKSKKKSPRGVVYVKCLPFGFYEKQLEGYFGQFGKVTGVYVPKSKKTGRAKGYGFVEFLDPEVAEIAAETMNNYLMFNRLIKTEIILPENQRPYMFSEKFKKMKAQYSESKVKENIRVRSRLLSKKRSSYIVRATKNISHLQKSLKNLGVDYKFKIAGLGEGVTLRGIKNIDPEKQNLDVTNLKNPVKLEKEANEVCNTQAVTSGKKKKRKAKKEVSSPSSQQKETVKLEKEADEVSSTQAVTSDNKKRRKAKNKFSSSASQQNEMVNKLENKTELSSSQAVTSDKKKKRKAKNKVSSPTSQQNEIVNKPENKADEVCFSLAVTSDKKKKRKSKKKVLSPSSQQKETAQAFNDDIAAVARIASSAKVNFKRKATEAAPSKKHSLSTIKEKSVKSIDNMGKKINNINLKMKNTISASKRQINSTMQCQVNNKRLKKETTV